MAAPKPNKAGYTGLDVSDPDRVQALVTANLIDMHREVLQHRPDIHNIGAQWYPKVQKATEQEVKQHFGRTLQHSLAGPGVVAAVSPNMDWERGNINAFGELAGLKPEHWKAIEASYTRGKEIAAENKALKESGGGGIEGPRMKGGAFYKGGRSRQVSEMLAGMDIRKAPDANLIKANKILQGEDPRKILSWQTAPKTHSFMMNIAGDPHYVTIDGRAFDMAVNQMRPWESGRNINTGSAARGPSHYEVLRNAYQAAAHTISINNARTGQRVPLQPHHLQAILWEYGKHVETSEPLPSGEQRQKGVTRVGQPYVEHLPMLVPSRVAPAPDTESESSPQAEESLPPPVLQGGRNRAARRRVQ